MCENVKSSCSCDIGYDKGVLKKTVENNIFTIFGNLIQDNYIVIRYHGILTENNNSNNLYINYCYDLSGNEKKKNTLTRCSKCEGECYCAVLNLEKHTKIFFSFSDNTQNIEDNNNQMFELDIQKDPISSIMQRYGFEQNNNLPVSQESENIKIHYIKSILENIKYFLQNIFNKKQESSAN